jgi:hypothetical protein
MLSYRERQLPICFEGDVDQAGESAEVRLLFGGNLTYRVRVGDVIPQTNLEVTAIEQHWSEGKEGQGRPIRYSRLVVRELTTGDMIGVTPDDPGRSAKSFARMRHEITGQVYEVRRGDQFQALGGHYRVVDLRPSEVVVEELGSGVVSSLPRSER